MPPTPGQTAKEQLTDHRLESLEEATRGARQVERDTDHLKISVAHLGETLGELKSEQRSVMAEFKAEVRERDTHTRDSLARIHRRLDEIVTDEAREDGARTARLGMTRMLIAAIAASASVSGVIVAALALVLKIT